MPRRPRLTSDSGIYHVMLRGIDKRDIFEDDADRLRFLDCLATVRTISGLTIYAYCLMDNHVHLLIETGHESLGLTMKRVGVRYAQWFNRRHGRVGHLFQDRFRSEPVDDDRYFVAVLRYIWRNPVEAGLSPSAADYPWGSRYWLDHPGGLVNSSDLTRRTGVKDLHDLDAGQTDQPEPPGAGPIWPPSRLSDRDALALVREITGTWTKYGFQRLPREEQRRAARELAARGVSARQLARVTGISKARAEWWSRPHVPVANSRHDRTPNRPLS